MIEEFYEELQEVKAQLDSVKLELEAERHNHKKDNEYLIGQRDKLAAAVETLANEWVTKATEAVTRAHDRSLEDIVDARRDLGRAQLFAADLRNALEKALA